MLLDQLNYFRAHKRFAAAKFEPLIFSDTTMDPNRSIPYQSLYHDKTENQQIGGVGASENLVCLSVAYHVNL
jgi:hypothetical protein